MRLAILGIVLPLFLVASAARAQSDRGDELADKCKSFLTVREPGVLQSLSADQVATMAMDAGYCVGYINGFVGGKSFGESKSSGSLACVPKDISIDQYARVIVASRDRAPQFGNMPQLAFFIGSVQGAWPCSK